MRKCPRRGGFTLIELLVVIAIIAILAAILFPVFARARAQARKAPCTAHLRQIGQALFMYRDQNNGQYPYYLTDPNYAGQTFAGTPGSTLDPYIKNKKVFLCPADWTEGQYGPFGDPSWEYWHNTSYAYHASYWHRPNPGVPPGWAGWLDAQTKRWGPRYIVAACPWHRHELTKGSLDPLKNIRDLALRADGSVRSFIWPSQNWDSEPYGTMTY